MALDPRLRQLIRQPAAESDFFGFGPDDPDPLVDVLVETDGSRDEGAVRQILIQGGFRPRSVIDGFHRVWSGMAKLSDLSTIDQLPGVVRLEALRSIESELTQSLPACAVPQAHSTGASGEGVVVGIIDDGVDWRHSRFKDAAGQPRHRFVWDQRPDAMDMRVQGGKLQTREELAGNPIPHLVHWAEHGTLVNSIAAAIAPSAELAHVCLKFHLAPKKGIGSSTRAIDALSYLLSNRAGKPIAINLSQGTSGGGHLGETVLELALDNLSRLPGVVIVKSAGNELALRTTKGIRHAGGTFDASGQAARSFTLPTPTKPYANYNNQLEIWADPGAGLQVQAVHPDKNETPSPWCSAATNDLKTLQASGVEVTLEGDSNAEGTGFQRVFVFLRTTGVPSGGPWTLNLRGSSGARFDVWIERIGFDYQARFPPGQLDPGRTITVPGNARRVVTVAALHGSQPAGFSSRGPTRSSLAKPDLAAPGYGITGAGPNQGTHTDSGTSFAAPHVTGVAALILEQHPALSGEQVRQILVRSATALPSSAAAVGGGRLSAEAALTTAAGAQFPTASVQVNGATVQVTTDLPTTAELRLHREKTPLRLGMPQQTMQSSTPGTTHTFSVADGPWAAEVIVTSDEDWTTIEDNDGNLWMVQ